MNELANIPCDRCGSTVQGKHWGRRIEIRILVDGKEIERKRVCLSCYGLLQQIRGLAEAQ